MQQNSFFNGIEDNPKTDNAGWISFHIYHALGYTDWILISIVYDVVKQLFNDGVISQFFFIRYYDIGYHLRIRFKATAKGQKYLRNNFEVPLLISQYEIVIQSDEILKSQHSIIYKIVETEYKQEVERYGGEIGIVLAESLFHQSSLSVLEIMKAVQNWQSDSAISMAIVMHVVLIHYLIKNDEEKYTFYSFTSDAWSDKALDYIYANTKVKSDIKTLQNYYFKSYTQLKPGFKKLLKPVNQMLKKNHRSADLWLNCWSEFGQVFSEKIHSAILAQELTYNTDYNINKPYFSIFESYLHMTNNRLGISNHNESFVYYILKQLQNDSFIK